MLESTEKGAYLLRREVGSRLIRSAAVLLCCVGYLHAQDVETLLDEYSRNNVLSRQTIDENRGNLTLFTREMIERMHAKTLKDLFKTTPVLYYHENRYGLPDPLYSGGMEPYRSNFIRIFVDGVEITQGWAGSGLALYGDINIDFVDHVEFYYMAPSFGASAEPAFMTIFLYSKDPKRDSGGSIGLVQGSRGYNSQEAQYGNVKQNFSYMLNVSHTDAVRQKVDNGTDDPLSRDFERLQVFGYIKSDTQFFHLQVMKKDTDSFAGLSLDATPDVSTIDYDNLHIDYGLDLSPSLQMKFSFDRLDTDIEQEDTLIGSEQRVLYQNDLSVNAVTSSYTAELTYKDTIGSHHVISGIKWRENWIEPIEENGTVIALPEYNTGRIFTAFLQDEYSLDTHNLLTLGITYNHISRNGCVIDDDLYQIRLGYVYANDAWRSKTYLYRMQVAVEPLRRNYYEDINIKPQTTVGVSQEISYHQEVYRTRFFLNYMEDKNSLIQAEGTGDGVVHYFTGIVDGEYRFDRDNSVKVQLYYAYYDDIFSLKSLEDIGAYTALFNRYEDIDFYNGFIWHLNSLDWTNYVDWTSTVTWNINEDLSLTLKGENILNRAKETSLFRLDMSTDPATMLEPLYSTPYDRRFSVELEYLF